MDIQFFIDGKEVTKKEWCEFYEMNGTVQRLVARVEGLENRIEELESVIRVKQAPKN